ncbi:MAG: hypothetical protein KatS3mg002_1115 [Candidatus Woesearchaeota archaeon]|nr:MAG: hypothetical protein KatS3mg002_1115 [Candidatus Woesearchaeota archaeon]
MDYLKRVINEEEAKNLMTQGYLAMDPHCHTSFSYDVPDVKETSPEQVVRKQKNKRLIPVITDHDTLKGYLDARRKFNNIVPAVEIRIKPEKAKLLDYKPNTLHINVYGLNKEQYEILNNIANVKKDLDLFIEFLKQEDLEWTYNHPFWHEKKEKLIWRAIPGLIKNYFDVIELNASMTKSINNLTINLAQKFDKGIVASSDSHTGNPGTAYVIAEGKNFKEFWSNIKERQMYVVRSDINAFTAVKEASLMIRNIFKSNNNPQKDKIFRSSIGIRPIDIIANEVTSGWLKNKHIIKKALEVSMQAINYGAGPILAWKYYLRKNNNLANRLEKRIESMALKMNNMKYRVKNNIKRTIREDKIINNVKAKKY